MSWLRQRRKATSEADGTTHINEDAPSLQSSKPSKSGLGLKAAFIILVASRLVSAWWNPVHDCDEVYNYWEPLHFLMYGSGMQTWEYSAEFALRSYFYLLLHAPAALASSLLTKEKYLVFYGVKAFLGLTSALVELHLYRAVKGIAGPRIAGLLLLFLAFSTGMFVSATSLLPSSFAMYMLTGAAAGVLEGRPGRVIVFAVTCVVWGWPVAGIALLPFALWVLLQPALVRSIGILLASLAVTLSLQIVADRTFYGKWTNSLWNFLKYNVVGGGDSALYGVESATYYLRNGVLNLNLLLPLALIAPIMIALFVRLKSGGANRWRLVCALLPVWVWLIAITLLPHKEERFLYVVYPLVCLGAAVSLQALCVLVYRASAYILHRKLARSLAGALLVGTVFLFLAFSVSRTTAMIKFYGAPMEIYRHLPKVSNQVEGEIAVCVGAEWHRFPSSFFLPTPRHRLKFIKSGFTGLLPRAFDLDEGGTAASSEFLNDRNREEPANYWADDSKCAFLVELQEDGTINQRITTGWTKLQSFPFVLAHMSPVLLARALYIPFFSVHKNRIGDYALYIGELAREPSLMETLSLPKTAQGRPFR